MEQLVAAGPWGAIGGLVVIILLLLRSRNPKGCPAIGSSGAPLTKEQHDEVCSAKWDLNEEKLKRITETTARIELKVDALPAIINGGKKS